MAISALGALHVVVLTGARIPYAMARDGAFFQFTARIQPTFRTPSGSLLLLGSIGALLALTGTYEELYSLFVFAVWIFFALNAMALLRLRKKEPGLSALPRLGLSLDATRLLAGRDRTDREFVDAPPRAFLARPCRHSGRHPFFLPLAKFRIRTCSIA